MFRLPYRYTYGELMRRTSEDHDGRAQGPPDLAEAIFGHTRVDTGKQPSSKGRAVLGLFTCTEGGGLTDIVGPTVRSSPRPSFYPFYIRQRGNGRTVERYQTLMDEDSEIRGWKRYPVRDATRRPEDPPDNANKELLSRWRAVEAESIFSGELRVHNLSPVELGALIWALDFGGSGAHSLGGGRPYGYGTVRLAITSFALEDSRGRAITESPLAGARTAFERFMEDQLEGRWGISPQITQLRAMADPNAPSPHPLRYMGLVDFRQVKNEKQYLLEFATVAAPPSYLLEVQRIASRPLGQQVAWLTGECRNHEAAERPEFRRAVARHLGTALAELAPPAGSSAQAELASVLARIEGLGERPTEKRQRGKWRKKRTKLEEERQRISARVEAGKRTQRKDQDLLDWLSS